MLKHLTKRAGLFGLALLLGACGAENAPPDAPTPDEQQALAEAEEMIEIGRPSDENAKQSADEAETSE